MSLEGPLFRCEIDGTPYVVAIAASGMTLFMGGKKWLDEIPSKLQKGEDVAGGFGTDITTLDFERVKKITGPKSGFTAQVHKGALRRLNLTFPSEQEALRFFCTVEELSGARRSERFVNRLLASIVPAFWVLAALVFTVVLVVVGLVFQAGDTPSEKREKGFVVAIYLMAAFLGPVGGGILGLILTALFSWYFMSRYRNPPVVVELTSFESSRDESYDSH